MKKQLFFLLFCLPLCLFAQQRSFELHAGSLKLLDTKERSDFGTLQTTGNLGYHFGIAYTGIIGKKTMLKSGIRWSFMKNNFQSPFFGDFGGVSLVTISQATKHIEVPILLRKEFDIKGVYLDYGLSFYFLRTLKEGFLENGVIVERENVFFTEQNTFRCYVNTAFGYQHDLDKTTQLFIQGEGQARLPRQTQNNFFLVRSATRVEVRLGFTLGLRFIIPTKTTT